LGGAKVVRGVRVRHATANFFCYVGSAVAQRLMRPKMSKTNNTVRQMGQIYLIPSMIELVKIKKEKILLFINDLK
jgi:hypothetical protein